MSFQDRIDRVMQRRNPDRDAGLTKVAMESLQTEASDIARYVKLSMMAVDAVYTQKSINAGKNVMEHLKRELDNVSFEFQGSVVSNTHIKGGSDIDLLVLCEKFFTWDRLGVVESLDNGYYNNQVQHDRLQRALSTPKYEGDIIRDMGLLRSDCERIMRGKYDICDSRNSKAIKVTNQNLRRNVDVVIGSWFDDVTSIMNDKSYPWRGVMIYNKQRNARENADYPFQCIELMERRDRQTNGRLKKMIRFLKTLKEDSDKRIDFSSFGIYAICYSLPIESYANSTYLDLVAVLTNRLYSIVSNESERSKLKSVDGRETVFTSNAIRDGATALYNELFGIYSELRKGLLL